MIYQKKKIQEPKEFEKSGVEKYNPKPSRKLIPPFMRKSVSDSFLKNNPQYKDLFKKCPSCNNNSLCNVDIHARTIQGRICRECGYTNDKL